MAVLQISDYSEESKTICIGGMLDCLPTKIHVVVGNETDHQLIGPSEVVFVIVVSLRCHLEGVEIIIVVVNTVEHVFVSRLRNGHVTFYLDVHVEQDGEINNCSLVDQEVAVVIKKRDGIFTVRGLINLDFGMKIKVYI